MSDKIDAVLTNKWIGIPIFAAVMFLLFAISQAWVGPLIADAIVGLIEMFQDFMGEVFADANPLLSAITARFPSTTFTLKVLFEKTIHFSYLFSDIFSE